MVRSSLLIDLNQFSQNLRRIRSLIPKQTKLMLVAKANAYGLGAAPLACHADVDYFGVIWPTEGIELRQAGITRPILLLSEPVGCDLRSLLPYHFTYTVYTKEFADSLAALQTPISVHIKIDTGMGRLGHPAQNAHAFINYVRSLNLHVEGIYTHYSRSDEPDAQETKTQLNQFLNLTEGLGIALRHSANSQAMIHFPETHLDMVRVGLAAYENIMTFRSSVEHVKEFPAGSPIGYGASHVTQQATAIATVNAGYADGIPPSFGNRSQVLINGKKYPIVGKICMDMFMVDIGLDSKTQAGDDVVIVSKENPIDDSLGINPRQFTCNIGARVSRIYR